jgi:DNA modification methylase
MEPVAATRPSVHPAIYSKQLVEPIVSLLLQCVPSGGSLLDPFGGLGHRFADIAVRAGMNPVAVEIEPGYFDLGMTHPWVRLGDSTDLRSLGFTDSSFDAAVTSPVYPNGMADDFHANDSSVRHTYSHRLRAHLGADYEMHPNNAGAMNPRRSPRALEAFYDVNRKVWAEVYRVLKPGAPFIVNAKDTVAVEFVSETKRQLSEAGFIIVGERHVDTPGLNHGKNQDGKPQGEYLILAAKVAVTKGTP